MPVLQLHLQNYSSNYNQLKLYLLRNNPFLLQGLTKKVLILFLQRHYLAQQRFHYIIDNLYRLLMMMKLSFHYYQDLHRLYFLSMKVQSEENLPLQRRKQDWYP